MRQRGFTVIELLVGMALFLVLSGLVWQGVKPQVDNAGVQVRVANMQTTSRSGFDLLARDMRMAGYGVELGMPGVPSPASMQSDVLTLYGNYTNIKTSGSGAGSLVVVVDATGFKIDNYLVIRGFLGGECSRIAGVGANTLVLATPLTRVYPSGSEVTQLERVQYQVSGQTLLRDNQPLLDGLAGFTVQYYLDDGSLVADPTVNEAAVRSALVTLQMSTVNPPGGTAPSSERMTISSEIRIRNLGLFTVSRP